MTKPNPGEPVMVEIAGRALELRFPLKALKVLDIEHHIGVLKGDGLGDALRDPAKLALILYYGLRTRNPDITLDWVEENVDACSLMALAPMLAYATTGIFPDMEKILAKVPNVNGAATAPTGSPSGPSADTTSGVVN